MRVSLSKRVALVTGGSKGIGKEIARSMIAAGAAVTITARDPVVLDSAANELRQPGGAVLGISADVTDEQQVVTVMQATVERFGGLDILICCAGGAVRYGGWADLTDEDWRASFELNVLGTVHYVRAAEEYLVSSPAPRIVVVSSISGMQPGRFNPHYTTAKAATINLSKYLADHYASSGILVNAVCPGPVHSDSWDRAVARSAHVQGIPFHDAWEQFEQDEVAKVPLRRIGEGADIASLVVFLASEHASWITGSCFHINGGKLRSMA
jgi:NAD(P)-dependent dehydrogenase (short-subunit alcohol dehydrogenase family)